MAGPEFVHLHCHSDYSLLDGCARVDKLIARAQALGQPAVALTDHGNLFGLIDFYKTARKAGVKPLLGCEVYLAKQNRLEKADKDENTTHHMGLLAVDFRGYQNLVKLVSDAHVHGFFRHPRTDIGQLARYAEGLVGFSGCLQGVIPQLILKGRMDEARAWCGRFVDIFTRERFFIEIQDHGIEAQHEVTLPLLKLAEDFSLKVVCTNDVHYVEREDSAPHEVLLCIQTGAHLDDEKRMRYEKEKFFLKDRAEMATLFKERPDSLTNTLAVAEMCDVQLPFGQNHYPVYPIPEGSTFEHAQHLETIQDAYVELKNSLNDAQGIEERFTFSPEARSRNAQRGSLLLQLCIQGLHTRYGVDYHAPGSDQARELVQRLDYELSIIAGTGFIDYFLIVADFIRWALEQGISVGPGRGSGAGCLVAYLLNITNIDPLRFGLLFERFLNPERISPPDFDIDFCMRRRDEVVAYVRRKYGKECVANIITFGTFGAKMIVRDIARVTGLSYSEGDRLAKMVPDDLNISLAKAQERSKELAKEVEKNPDAARIVNYGKVIEGMVRNTGKHACGIIIGDRPLDEFIPLTLQEGDLTTQYPKEPVEELGLLKMDFLGLKTLTVISDAEENVRQSADPHFRVANLGFEDAKTFELLNSGRTVGVFQLESGGMQNLCRQFQIASIDEIIALIALYRPGPMDLIPSYIKGKRDPSTVTYPHPLLEEVCRETYGIMVYQEQVMEAARRIAGYTLGGADILRRAMGKKKVEVMAAERARFIEGAKRTNGIAKEKAEEIFALLEKFAGYGFNKSHSAAYGILSYQTAYLKANYPLQFMAAVLTCEQGNADKLARFVEECLAMELPLLGPDVNESRENFTPVIEGNGGSIRFGLAAIKGVGSAASAILAEREGRGAFRDFDDFLSRVDSKAINRRVLEALIKAGAFDQFGEDRGILLESLDDCLKHAAALQRDRASGQAGLFDSLDDSSRSNGAPRRKGQPLPLHEKLLFEKELLGFYISGHPMNRYRGIAEQLDSFQGEQFQQFEDRTPFRLCGVVSGIQKKISRKSNSPWAIVTLSTRKHNHSVIFWPELYQLSQDFLAPGHTLLVLGSVSERNGSKDLVADHAKPLETALPEQIERLTWILDPNGSSPHFLSALKRQATAHPGHTRLEVGFLLPDSRLLLAETAASLNIHPTAELLASLRHDYPCVRDIKLATKPLEKPAPRWKRRSATGD